jgi:DNA-binding MarR family transcriptional regulator
MQVKYLRYIPVSKLVEQGLNPTQLLLAAIIVSFHTDEKSLRAGLGNISEALGLSPKTIQRAMPKLIEQKLITVISGYKERNANEYKPTKKLLALYGQNDRINMDKMTTHKPKGYIKENDAAALARRHNFQKEYEQDVKAYNEEYAEKRLKRRIEQKETK